MNRACIEVSWEVANAIGGIHTVLASKAQRMREIYDDHYLVVGPWVRERRQEDVWEDHPLDPAAMRALDELARQGIATRTGRWRVPGHPTGLLIDFSRLWAKKDELLADYWERYGLESLLGQGDYQEPLLFGVAAGRVAESLARDWLEPAGFEVILHAHEWLAASSILHVRHSRPEIATVFTTHATALGRTLASRAHLPETQLAETEARRLAEESGVSAKHSMEFVASRVADVFSTVSDTTALECERILGVRPMVLPNALAEDYPPAELRAAPARERGRRALLELASRATGQVYSEEGQDAPLLVLTSGRYEFRNKGMDVLAEALGLVQAALGPGRAPKLVAFYLVPADAEEHAPTAPREKGRLTHALRREEHDPLLAVFDHAHLRNDSHSAVHVAWIPRFLDGSDSLVPRSYFELLAGADLTVFPSWYEPWGYTPMESVALGIPTVTSDLTGFSDWAFKKGDESATGVFRIRRRHRTHRESVQELAEILFLALRKGRMGLRAYEGPALALSRSGTWGLALDSYLVAHGRALENAAARLKSAALPSNFDSAYFSMEFAVSPQLHIYSGGLGVLAGDYLKAARDRGERVCGLGLAYREGYFRQAISEDLRQEVLPAEHAAFERCGLQHITNGQGLPLQFTVPLPDGGEILSTAWKLEMGTSQLLLLDTDVDANRPELRGLARRLYATDRRERWLQEYFLGVGGMRLLSLLGIRPKWLHMNEGHTALLAFERIRELMLKRLLNFNEAMEETRRETLFTTHTPVPAGHEVFEPKVSQSEVDLIAAQLRVNPERIWSLARSGNTDGAGFSMTALALNVCSKVNAVSRRHRVSAERSLDGVVLEHKHLFSITNGVHPQTWISPEWQTFFREHLGPGWLDALDGEGALEHWARVFEIPDSLVWKCHLTAKAQLIRTINQRINAGDFPAARSGALNAVKTLLRDEKPEDLMMGVFARRFTAYKRPDLLFNDLRRLRDLIAAYPRTLFIFSGKAHPADTAGQELIHRVLKLESSADFMGHVIFLQDYGMSEAQYLVSGSDLWINVPQQPLEASGTSGMKAAMNGVLNLSVNDGWVPEAVHGEVPWKIGVGTETLEPIAMDWVHAQELYATLESEVLPEFASRDADGLPRSWIARMKCAIAAAVPRFSAQRMVREYSEQMKWHQGRSK